MFEQNKYYVYYNNIITNAKKRGANKNDVPFLTERHHIIPKSMGGEDTDNNLVLLSLKEHFVCHHLLTKCVKSKKLYSVKHAFSQMVNCGKFTPTARHYNKARKFYAEGGRSKEWRQRIGDAHRGKKRPQKYVEAMRKSLTGRKLTEAHKENIRQASIKRGMSPQCREARLNQLIKQFKIILPTGDVKIIENLKQYCTDNEINYSSASNNSKTEKPISRGPLKGYNFMNIMVDYTN
jgi:hypothetical protein